MPMQVAIAAYAYDVAEMEQWMRVVADINL